MKTADILSYRLANQQITGTRFSKPHEMVACLGAMQSQEYAMAKWAIGLRLPGIRDADVEQAFNRGEILRTHCMRPTWHFVTPRDIRWIQALTGPRVQAFSASYYRKMELDAAIFTRGYDAVGRALQGGKQLTRPALREALERAHIKAEGLRLAYLLMSAELDCIICSGAREGKQFTYALMDERAPRAQARQLDREEALFELTRMYFTTRGPAMLQDFAWWSGLTMLQVKKGISMLGKALATEVIEGKEYYFDANMIASKERPTLSGGRHQTTFLMPDYDEYGISYKDRSVLFSEHNTASISLQQDKAYSHMIVIDGRVGGVWQPIVKGKQMVVDTIPFKTLATRKRQSLSKATERYLSFFLPSPTGEKQKDNNLKVPG